MTLADKYAELVGRHCALLLLLRHHQEAFPSAYRDSLGRDLRRETVDQLGLFISTPPPDVSLTPRAESTV